VSVVSGKTYTAVCCTRCLAGEEDAKIVYDLRRDVLKKTNTRFFMAYNETYIHIYINERYDKRIKKRLYLISSLVRRTRYTFSAIADFTLYA